MHSQTQKKRLSAPIDFVLRWSLIKNRKVVTEKCAAGLWTPWFWVPEVPFCYTEQAISTIQTVTNNQPVWPAGWRFSQAAPLGSHCRECHFYDELWGLWQHNGCNGAHFHSISTTHWNHTEAQHTQPLITTPVSLVTWGLVEAGDSVGGCSFITVVTVEEPEPKTPMMGEGGSLGGVMLREGEVAEAEEERGSSNRSLSFNAELSSGENPEQREIHLFFLCQQIISADY